MAKIGDRRQDGKIYAGPDYGYQSPATYLKLKSEGAFKLGASAVRRTAQAVRGAMKFVPQPIKDFYSKAGERENQRYLDRGFTQKQIDEANAEKARLSVGSGQADEKAIRFLSDNSNIAPEIIGAAVTAGTMAIDARVGANSAKRTLTNAVRKMDAPVAYASGGAMRFGTADDVAKHLRQQQAAKAAAKQPWKPTVEPKTGRLVGPNGGRVPSPQRGTRVLEDGTVVETRWRRNQDGSFTLDVLGEPETITASDGSTFTATPAGIEPKPVSKSRYAKDIADENSLEIMPDGSVPRRKIELPNYGGYVKEQGPRLPRSKQGDKQPGTSRGAGPETRRAAAKDTTPPETFLDVEDVHTSDMAKNYSDGNQYNSRDNIPGLVPAKERTRQRNEGTKKQINNLIEARVKGRRVELDLDAIENDIFFADGDLSKLSPIAKRLGVDPDTYKNPSQLERAIKKRISGLEKTYAGKATVSTTERAQIAKEFDLKTNRGQTQAEVNRLNKYMEPGNQDGTNPKPRPIIRRMGDDRLPANREFVDQKKTRESYNPDSKPSTRTEEITAKKDLEFYMERYEYKVIKDAKGRDRVEFLLDDEGAYIPKGIGIKPTDGPKDPDFTRKIRARMNPRY